MRGHERHLPLPAALLAACVLTGCGGTRFSSSLEPGTAGALLVLGASSIGVTNAGPGDLEIQSLLGDINGVTDARLGAGGSIRFKPDGDVRLRLAAPQERTDFTVESRGDRGTEWTEAR